ncbi:hypothetical protein [Longitalea luteola]|uniref:hypothetical protein n=1 Tax=Longitalea luteola TaxID=2812563 RepID=UPI001A978CA1|nr:hypothetical protein [Longitalea luteola]
MLSGVEQFERIHNQNGSIGSRAEMEKFENQLPHHVKEELKKGKLRYADTIIYSIKHVGSKVVKMFEPQDDRQVGICSIAGGKLPKNQCLLVSGIQVFTGVSPNTGKPPTKDEILSTSTIGLVQSCLPLHNGEFTLKANQKIIVPETSCKLFFGQGFTGFPPGYYKLENPRLIQDEWQIEFTFELATTQGLLPNQLVFVGLRGTITTP